MSGRVVSVCSGAGGMDLGFHRAGFTTVALCEYDPWRRELLAQNFPGVPIWPDLTTLDPSELPDADVLIGGTPCQDLSAAGKRAGLDGSRSRLYWDFQRIRLANGIEWCVWENVAGALSSNHGLDFAQVLAAMVGADVDVPAGGWPGAGVVSGPWGGAVWRLLDAQHFGVPQRRRRVFVAGHLGGACPPEVLFELASGDRHPAPREGSWQDLAGTVGGGAHGAGRRSEDDDNYIVNALDTQRGGADDNSAQAGHIVAGPVLRRHGKGVDSDCTTGHIVVANTLKASGVNGGRTTDVETTLVANVGTNQHRARRADADVLNQPEPGRHGGAEVPDRRGRAPAYPNGVRAADGLAGSLDGSACCVEPLPDGRRYAACGDGVVAPVAEWIGRRLAPLLTPASDRNQRPEDNA